LFPALFYIVIQLNENEDLLPRVSVFGNATLLEFRSWCKKIFWKS